MHHTLAALLLVFSTLAAAAEPLAPRQIAPKPRQTVVEPERVSAEQIVLKLHEGTRARLRNDALSFDAQRLDDEDRRRMARVGLRDEVVQADVAKANGLLANAGASLHRLLARSEDAIDLERPPLERQEGEELADLNLYFMVRLRAPDAKASAALIDALNELASVEIAYAEPLPAAPLAVDLAPTTTINIVPNQFYTLPSNLGGIDSDWAGRFAGGRGAGIRIIDVEAGWTTTHEDLPNLFSFDGWNFADYDHGVAVLGVLGAGRNSYGATGIVTDAALGASSVVYPVWHSPHSIAAAIDNAALRLSRGDVLMIEQHVPFNIPFGNVCVCNCPQFGFLPAEIIQATFDVIRNATARGIVVVEAAGNGAMNLDDPYYLNLFNRNFRDSRAIVVGAGDAAGNLTSCAFSNFGTRVDVQSLGGGVATLGFGTPGLRANGNDFNQFYTTSFSGTSSATPLVAGAVAAVNGNRLADGVGLLDSFFMRQWLRSTGVPQPAPVTRAIGPRIDLRAAMPRITGELESVDASGWASGFAFHSGTNASITVTFDVDGVQVGSTTANLARPDVNTRFDLVGQHGFLFRIPYQFHDDQTHVLRATGQVPAGAGGTARVLTFTRSFKLASIRGHVDGADTGNGVVSGWAFFGPTSASSMQVYVRLLGSGTPVGFFTTATPRPDVNAAYGITGVHGFDVQMPSRLRGSTLTVEVSGVHPVNGSLVLLGTHTFTWYMRPISVWPY